MERLTATIRWHGQRRGGPGCVARPTAGKSRSPGRCRITSEHRRRVDRVLRHRLRDIPVLDDRAVLSSGDAGHRPTGVGSARPAVEMHHCEIDVDQNAFHLETSIRIGKLRGEHRNRGVPSIRDRWIVLDVILGDELGTRIADVATGGEGISEGQDDLAVALEVKCGTPAPDRCYCMLKMTSWTNREAPITPACSLFDAVTIWRCLVASGWERW
jgi:hypothetical protein